MGLKLERVMQMSAHEVVRRGCQEASKRWDRMAAWVTPTVLSAHRQPRRAGAHGQAAGGRFGAASVSVDSGRFFEGAANTGMTAAYVAQIPESTKIISSADEICQGRFDLLGCSGLAFGDPVDWHLDPHSGHRAPPVHWSRLDPLDSELVGDSKVVWELNRHQWLLGLGQAYQFTGDERYAAAFARYVREWMLVNPVGIGINWVSSLEVALRLISWCWALVLFEGSQALSDELREMMVAGIADHARRVERYLSYEFSPNTHLTGEALGLFYAGVLFPDLARARHWRTRGARILIAECQRQILPDGVYFEQSTCYQRYTAEIYLHFLVLAARNGLDVPGTVATRLQQLVDFLIAVRRPDGSMPDIGDADGGWLFPLVPRAPGDLRGIWSVAAAFFGRPDYAWAAGGVTPEVFWLLGPTGAKAFEALVPAPPRTTPSQVFPHGGYVVMRSGWEPDAHQLIFDVGPLGCPISGGHGHADLLSVQCAVFGDPYLVDAGTYCYGGDSGSRDYFRSTQAHSTIIVDDEPQAIPAGPFRWQARPSARLLSWLPTPEADFADADHQAYLRLSGSVIHRRRVVFVRDGYWVLVDDLEGTGEHRVALQFQFAPIELDVDPTLWARAHGRAGRGLLIRPFAAVPLSSRIHSGELDPIHGWVSTVYSRRSAAPALVYSAVTSLPLRIMTLLLPTVDSHADVPSVVPLVGKDRAPVGLMFDDGRGVHFSGSGVAVLGPRERGGSKDFARPLLLRT
ncbi:MAG TPA: alginate lyase family protein [bacterium]|nr:alginate lyase family protein [bacterium]